MIEYQQDVVVLIITLFLLLDLLTNFSIWKEESSYKFLGSSLAKEYKNKCWIDIISLMAIVVYFGLGLLN